MRRDLEFYLIYSDCIYSISISDATAVLWALWDLVILLSFAHDFVCLTFVFVSTRQVWEKHFSHWESQVGIKGSNFASFLSKPTCHPAIHSILLYVRGWHLLHFLLQYLEHASKKTSAWVLQNLAFLLSLDYSLELLFQQSPGRNLQNTSAYVWRSSTKHTQFEQTKTKSSWSLPVSPRKLSVESYSSAQTTKLTGIPENFVPFWVGFVDHKTTKQQLKPRHSLSSSSSSAASLGHGAVGAVDPPKRLMVSCDIMQHHYACWLVYGKIMWNIPHFLFTYMGYFNAMYHGWQTPTEKYSTPKKSKSGLGAFEDKNPLKTHSLSQVLLK